MFSVTEPIQHPLNSLSTRSPSPPPQYDNFGRRVNTREYRYRKRLEDERHKQIEKAMKIIPNYHPGTDYPEITFSTITNPTLTHLSCHIS